MERRSFLQLIVGGLAIPVLLPKIETVEAVRKTVLEITKEDLLKAKLLKPGWYPVKILNFTELESQARPGDMNIRIDMETAEEQVPLNMYVAKIHPDPLLKLIEKAQGFTIDSHKGAVDLDCLIGKEVTVKIENKSYNKGFFNSVSI